MDKVPNSFVAQPLPREVHEFGSVPWLTLEPWLYLAFLGVSEIISDLKQPVVGLWMHAVLGAIMIVRGTQVTDRKRGRLYLACSIMAMVRIVSFAIAPAFISGVWFYVFAELPFLAAAITASRVFQLSLTDLGITRPRFLPLSLLVIASGVGAGWIEAQIIHPAALAPGLRLGQVWLPVLLLVVSTGLVEEVVFRGLIQYTCTQFFGPLIGVVYTALGWALLHIGWLSWADVGYVFCVGLVWGSIRYWNRSILDLAVAHGIANVMLFVVIPYMR
jgi:membrane protease YdiL (CAAX protease family)